jgi:hypothetical protein
MSLADLKGYYRSLGLAPGAPADAIKSAFRARAKEAHPDAGGGGEAFRLLAEAYDVLGDEARRADYDELCRAVQEARAARVAAAAPEPVRCARCGTVSAQPRHVRFFQVVALGRSLSERTFAGVFCRACADRVAIRASLVTWVAGWWSLRGPARSVLGLAAGLAQQAIDFRPDPSLDPLIAAGNRRLKDRWRPGGLAFVVQSLPLGLALAWPLVWAGGKVAGMIGY